MKRTLWILTVVFSGSLQAQEKIDVQTQLRLQTQRTQELIRELEKYKSSNFSSLDARQKALKKIESLASRSSDDLKKAEEPQQKRRSQNLEKFERSCQRFDVPAAIHTLKESLQQEIFPNAQEKQIRKTLEIQRDQLATIRNGIRQERECLDLKKAASDYRRRNGSTVEEPLTEEPFEH